MSFNIKIQRNNSEVIRMDKDITDIITVTGTLKGECSIIDPVILIEGNIADVANANYMHINQFNRDYFINNIVSVRSGLYEIRAHVDVISTYKTQIRKCTGITKRQENNWNLYLNDGSLKVYQNPHIVTKNFPSGFDTMEFVLSVAGG